MCDLACARTIFIVRRRTADFIRDCPFVMLTIKITVIIDSKETFVKSDKNQVQFIENMKVPASQWARNGFKFFEE